MGRKLFVVVVEPDRGRALEIIDGLSADGLCDVHVIGEASGLARKVSERNPDVVLIDVSHPSRDMLEELAIASDPMSRPVALFVDRDSDGMAKAAIEAGVSAYVVNGLAQDRLRPILDAAIARFSMMGRMRSELAETKRALEERKVIDRAKGLLMKARGIDENDAYTLLRRTAMDQGRKVVDVANALVTASDLLG